MIAVPVAVTTLKTVCTERTKQLLVRTLGGGLYSYCALYFRSRARKKSALHATVRYSRTQSGLSLSVSLCPRGTHGYCSLYTATQYSCTKVVHSCKSYAPTATLYSCTRSNGARRGASTCTSRYCTVPSGERPTLRGTLGGVVSTWCEIVHLSTTRAFKPRTQRPPRPESCPWSLAGVRCKLSP